MHQPQKITLPIHFICVIVVSLMIPLQSIVPFLYKSCKKSVNFVFNMLIISYGFKNGSFSTFIVISLIYIFFCVYFFIPVILHHSIEDYSTEWNVAKNFEFFAPKEESIKIVTRIRGVNRVINDAK